MKNPKKISRTISTTLLAGVCATGAMTTNVMALTQTTQQVKADATWNKDAVYIQGDVVTYNGKTYKAKYWNQGSEPGTVQWGPWEVVEEVTPPVTPEVPVEPEVPVDPDKPSVDEEKPPTPQEGQALTDEQINAYWGGINPEFSPEKAVGKMEALLKQSDFEALFPRRYGSELWHETNPGVQAKEYYSYENLKSAIKEIANIKYKVEYREGSAWCQRISRFDKTTKKEVVIFEDEQFNTDWILSKPVVTQIVDFGSFLSEGSEKDKQRELAAFLANIAHETGGGWETAPGGMLAWGLYFNEETSYIGTDLIGYVSATDKVYPPVAGKSYHGRGPIQLSWNYNYGLASAILYGDKNILLEKPEKVTEDGALGFMTAISFWMTPQNPKPSCHDIMANKWKPTEADIKAGRTEACFGMTINVINGGFEANKGLDDYRVKRRAGHYVDITTKMGVDITGEKIDTLGMQAF